MAETKSNASATMTNFATRQITEIAPTGIKTGVSKSLESSEALEVRAEQVVTPQSGAKKTLERRIKRSIGPSTLINADLALRKSDCDL